MCEIKAPRCRPPYAKLLRKGCIANKYGNGIMSGQAAGLVKQHCIKGGGGSDFGWGLFFRSVAHAWLRPLRAPKCILNRPHRSLRALVQQARLCEPTPAKPKVQTTGGFFFAQPGTLGGAVWHLGRPYYGGMKRRLLTAHAPTDDTSRHVDERRTEARQLPNTRFPECTA